MDVKFGVLFFIAIKQLILEALRIARTTRKKIIGWPEIRAMSRKNIFDIQMMFSIYLRE